MLLLEDLSAMNLSFSILLILSQSSIYSAPNIIRRYRNRLIRSENVQTIHNGHVYGIKNAYTGLYFTAKSASHSSVPAPSAVTLRPWRSASSQLWEVTLLKPYKSFSLKPLDNEFNMITSLILKNTHSYHTWHFEKGREGKWMIKTVVDNGKRKCISGGNLQEVKLVECDSKNAKQLWIFENVDN